MATLRFAVIFAVYTAAALRGTEAHSSGACPGSCSTLIPQHEGATAVPGGAGPYSIRAPAQVAAGSTVTVSIGGAPFKGFIVRAMDANGSEGGSQFVDGGAGARYQPIACDASADTATHTDGSDKTSINLQWVAPSRKGAYRLVATIVKEYATFYSGYYTDVIVQ